MTLMTGDDYLDSLRDGRNVYLGGEKIADVTTHRAFRNAARSIASLYDALHGEHRERLTAPDARGQITHRFFKPSYCVDDLLAAQDAIELWSRMTYGFMGRTPDYKAAFMSGLEAGAGYYGEFRQHAVDWHRRFAAKGLYLNHALIDPPFDRSKPIHDMRDVFVHVVAETARGIVVSGVKMLATAGALTHATFVAPVASARLEAGKAEDFALVFFARMDNPGLSLMCRPSYEAAAPSPFDAPLASRFDENDSVVIFDQALIPWEDVLVYRDVERASGFYAASGFANLYNLQSGIRLAVKLELLIGLLSLGTQANGTHAFRAIQAALGELIALRDLLKGLVCAMARDPERTAAGVLIPKLEYASALRVEAPRIWLRAQALLAGALGGAPLVTASSAADLLDPRVRPLIDAYYRGAALAPEQRIKLFKLIWDATRSEFGSRHTVYETHYAGNFDQIRLDALNWATRRGQLADHEAFAQHCMDDYGTQGWLRGPWRSD
ncbi:4-hydroxyphenylacetate 3-hydroxylase family protein [Paraburkholderia sp. BL21I4N1]|uniref:4-hydroxyphenylacetate 3-hydroxylase family protein n=1 Tax=Paraburkholderia sp. BL21I4N1 TaxID=1938801 RepID=UPI000CFB0C9B|nr:4-hydroxyphenylacetate 3-hydroxylase N-terminal domain-containing protein [Paraburkholderia sp. BL21I4N1]